MKNNIIETTDKDEWEYYLKRGNRYYFRNFFRDKKIMIETNDSAMKDMNYGKYKIKTG